MHSMLRSANKAVVVAMLGLASTSASAGGVNHNVAVGQGGLVFVDAETGTNVTNIAAGDTVTFTNIGGLHNVASDPGAVTSFHCSAACGDSPAGNPNSTLWQQTVTFPTPGVIGYFCEQHGSPGQGMSGTINVTIPVDLQSFDIE